MAFQHGSNAYVTIDGTNVTAYCDSQSLDQMVDLAETTVFGNDDKTSIAGLKSGSISVGGHWDPTGDAVFAGADDGAVVAFVCNPEGNTSGDVTYTGNAFITNYSWQAGVGDRVTWSASFTVSGATARATV
jgi:hypothetical protein